MRDYLEIGPAPCGETCVQVGSPNYLANARKECREFIQAIRRKLGPEPEGARLAVETFPHDFGDYLEVVCHYDPNHPDSLEYAYRCERDAPQTWAEADMGPPVRFGRGAPGR